MAHRLFEDTKIRKVTPGILSRYVNEDFDTKSVISKHSELGLTQVSGSTCDIKLKLYIDNIRLCKTCRKFLRQKFGEDCDIYLKLKWKFYDGQDCITAPEKIQHQRVKFNFQGKYHFEADDEFFKAVQVNPVIFELFAVSEEDEISIGKSEFFFEYFIETSTQKHESKVYFANKAIDMEATSVAILLVLYQFSSTDDLLGFSSNFKSQPSLAMPRLSFRSSARKLKIAFDRIYVSPKEIDNFQDSLQLVLNRNKALKTTQSEISTELKDRVHWLQSEANWKMTLQEHAILHGKNPDDIMWRQWRDDVTANVKLRDYTKKPVQHKPLFSIKIKSLKFFTGSSILKDEDINQFFIYYSFLRHEGPEMETGQTYLKPHEDEELIINFEKTFAIDLKKDREHCALLANMIKNYDKIRFMIINEPLENPEKVIQTCEEVAYAEVCVSDLMELDGNTGTFKYDILNSKNQTEVMGYLEVQFKGAMAARRMALLYMVPKDFTLLIYK